MARLTRLLAAISVLGLTTLVGTAFAQDDGVATDRLPRLAEYTGTLTLDRRAHDACQVTVPPVITAEVNLTVDTDNGTVTGGFVGTGSGRYVAPASCRDSTSDLGYEATLNYTATISGTVDAATGAISATAAVTVGGLYQYGALPGMIEYDKYIQFGGGRTCPENDGLNAYCSTEFDQFEETATLTGRLLPTAAVELSIDWFTVFCRQIIIEEFGWSEPISPDGCATLGTLEMTPGAVVWPRNDLPVIESLTVDPAEPDTNAAMTATVIATDPDGDPLTYAWTLDGAAAGSEPTIAFGPLVGGDHTVAVRVSDPAGEADDASVLITVFEAEVNDTDGDGIGDLDDACPTEPGPAPDGCPDFAASVGCSPVMPRPEQPVACTVNVQGLKTGETLQIDWYLDGGSIQSGPATAWQWDAATEGDHAVLVDVVGEGRSTSTTVGLVVTGGEVSDEVAGFSVSGLGCNSGITSDEILSCSATLNRTDDDVGVLAITWRIDGTTAFSEAVLGTASGWTLDRPAPGSHVVAVTVVDPVTNYVQAASTAADVRRGSNTTIPPGLQALAAGATALTIGAWLWLEAINTAQAEAEAALAAAEPPPRTDVPFWVDDPRPLAEIWAADAAADIRRHGSNDLRWDPDLNALVPHDYQSPEQIADIQRTAQDQWHQMTTTLDGAPGLADLASFVHHAEVHVVLPDGSIDLDALIRVQDAVDRLGQMELGIQRNPEYTYANAAWDTAGQAADNLFVRVGASLLVGPAIDPLLQTIAMGIRADQMVQAGMSDADIRHALTNEAVLYGGLFVTGLAGGQLIAANADWIRSTASSGAQQVLQQMPDDIANAITRAGQRTGTAMEHLANAGATSVSEAWDRGLAGTWQHAGNITRIGQLTAANPGLGSAVDELYQTIDDLGPRGAISSGSGLSTVEQNALDLLRSDPAGYREAVRQGLVPTNVHRTVNWARDKIVRNAIGQTIDDMGGQSSSLLRVDITGTGANPLGSKAASAWTDVDLTAMGVDGSDDTFRQMFAGNLDEAFGAPNASESLDVMCFAGRPGDVGGFTDDALIDWVKGEAHFTGRSVAVGESGAPIFDYRPDATLRPPGAGGPQGSTWTTSPHMSSGGGIGSATGARADVNRLISAHNTSHPPTSLLDELRANGKYAQRIWKVETTGLGEPVPPGIRILEQIKANRQWVPKPDQLAQAASDYRLYTSAMSGGTS